MTPNPLDAHRDAALAERGLPERAYMQNYDKSPSAAPVIAVVRGESGYHPIWTRLTADELNEADGVSPAQQAAMHHGSMFGWETSLALPSSYDEAGKPMLSAVRAHRRNWHREFD